MTPDNCGLGTLPSRWRSTVSSVCSRDHGPDESVFHLRRDASAIRRRTSEASEEAPHRAGQRRGRSRWDDKSIVRPDHRRHRTDVGRDHGQAAGHRFQDHGRHAFVRLAKTSSRFRDRGGTDVFGNQPGNGSVGRKNAPSIPLPAARSDDRQMPLAERRERLAEPVHALVRFQPRPTKMKRVPSCADAAASEAVDIGEVHRIREHVDSFRRDTQERSQFLPSAFRRARPRDRRDVPAAGPPTAWDNSSRSARRPAS